VTTDFEAIEASIALNSGDQLILYTDGIVEATNVDKDLFGNNRLDCELSASSTDPEEMIASLLKSVNLFSGGAAPSAESISKSHRRPISIARKPP
jgi:serine phosphatase RsbU (regulator of sigma subunit)